ncbi:MAG: pyrroline-5-carboxylate reductase [Verrucomicrobiota bacterium]
MDMLAIIGTGNMGRALTSGLVSKKIFRPSEIIGVDPVEAAQTEFLKISPELRWAKTPKEACAKASIILIAVKPQQIGEVVPQLENPQSLYLSIAAGVTIQKLESLLGNTPRIVRAMPNTPALLGCGVTAFAGNAHATSDDLTLAEKIFSAISHTYRVSEEELDAVTALSGSGPAYFYLFIDHLRKAAEAKGLNPKISLEMISRTAFGAAQMLLQTNQSPEKLISQVKSKGGTTEAALNAFSQQNFESLCARAFDAAYLRSKELSQGG